MPLGGTKLVGQLCLTLLNTCTKAFCGSLHSTEGFMPGRLHGCWYMRDDKTQKVAASSPSVRTGWRFLPKVDGNTLRKNSGVLLWDSLVLVWNVSLGWLTGKGWGQGRAFLEIRGLVQCEQPPWSTVHFPPSSSQSLTGQSLSVLWLCCVWWSPGRATCSSVCAIWWSEVRLKHFLVSDYR